MNKLTLVFALLAIVFTAGCASKNVSLSGGTGIEIVLFNAPAVVDAEEQFAADLVIQNVGDGIATNVNAVLAQKSNFVVNAPGKKEIDILYPPVPEKDVPGEQFVTSWILKAPKVPTDQVKSLVARVTYDYSSNATSNIYVVPKEQYDEMGAESFRTYSTSSNGPILISIQPLPAFKIRQGQKAVNALVVLSIQDVGGGSLVGKIENFKLTLTSGSYAKDITSSCSGVPIRSREIQLLGRNKGIDLKCEFVLPAGESSISYIVDATADYTYYIDSEQLSIDVISVPEGPQPTFYPISIQVQGAGSGSVASSPPGIDCPSDCLENFQDGISVAFTATPDVGSKFVKWVGCSRVSNGICTVFVDSAKQVSATFART